VSCCREAGLLAPAADVGVASQRCARAILSPCRYSPISTSWQWTAALSLSGATQKTQENPPPAWFRGPVEKSAERREQLRL